MYGNLTMSSYSNWLISITELLFVFLLTLLLIVYLQYRQRYKYWKQLGVEQLNPTFPVGDLSTSPFGMKSVFLHLQELHNQFREKHVDYGGIYFFKGPTFMPISPDLIKRVLVTDFDYFMDRGLYMDKEKHPITGHLIAMAGQEWRNARAKFTPAFTSGKMKSMCNIVVKNIDNLINILNEHNDGDELDIKYKLVRLTTDIIGTAAFGIDCNSLKYPDEEFPRMVDKIFTSSAREMINLAIEEGLDNPGNLIKIAHSKKEVVTFFTNLVHNTVKYRDQNQINRDDLMNILLKLRDTVGMSMEEIVAQSFLFFTAGYETSSSTMSNAIHELAHNQHVQDRLREEVVDNLGKDVNKYTYESVLSLPYLDKVFKETLRKYPPVGMLNRIVVKPYKLPNTDIVLQPGTPVIISTLGLQRDPEYFPDPMEFEPERFTVDDNNDSTIQPFTYLPFGDGPRNCIGMRFGIMQTKMGLAALISNYKFLPGRKSQRELPVNTNSGSIVITVKGGVPVKLIKV